MLNIYKTIRNASKFVKCSKQNISEVSLVGRDYISPRNLTSCELKSLLWTALELKYLSKDKPKDIPCLDKCNVTVILDNPNINTQIPLKNGLNILRANITTIIDKQWKYDYPYVCDFGRLLATTSNMIFCEIKEQNTIERIADGANVPVIGIDSSQYSIVKTLSDLMTIYEHFCRLTYLSLAWVGKPEALFNTYLLILPQMKMNLKYCLVEGKCNDKIISDARKFSQTFNTEIHELCATEEATHRANVIVTAAHEYPEYEISMAHMKEAELDWIFLHNMPRGISEVKTDVVAHKNCLIWKSVNNLQYIYAALMVRCLQNYEHTTPEPSFDSNSS